MVSGLKLTMRRSRDFNLTTTGNSLRSITMKHRLNGMVLLLVPACLLAFGVSAQLPSFPGAEGAGALTSGGRGTPSVGTTVFEVTSLADNGATTVGTLRWALSQTASYRTVVFRVSGTIHLSSKLTIKGNTTVAGQTAPGGGICIADYPVVISGDNVIVRYMRFRMGDKNQLKTDANGNPVDGSGGDDAFGNLGNKNLIVDHCSVSWSSDEALTIYRGDSVTLQWNFITEPLNYSYHFETGDADFERHGYGGIWGSQHGSFHHNLFAHCQSRNPRFSGSSTYAAGQTEVCDFSNNVIYNWGLYTVYGGEGGHYNLVNNYYKYGPSTGNNTKYRIVNIDSSTSLPYAQYFLSGNYVDGSASSTANNWLGVQMKSGKLADTGRSKVATPFSLPSLNTETAANAYISVLDKAGAILPLRDTLDARIVADVKSRSGRIIDVQGGYPHGTPYVQTVSAWPALASLSAPADTDHDGMPDYWETANSLNPNDASDRNVYSSTGYTNLEDYLNGITGNVSTGIGSGRGALNAEVHIFPNPASDKITISFPLTDTQASVHVYDVQGRAMTEQSIAVGKEECQVNISSFPRGTYFVVCRSGRATFAQAFLKQ
jgi:pectate lyase